MRWKIFFLVTFLNPWIWRIFDRSLVVFALLVVSTFTLYLTFRCNDCRYKKYISIVVLLFLGTFQYRITYVKSLVNLSNDDIRVRDMRLKELPPVKFTLVNKPVWIPLAHWFEGRPESISFFRILYNLSEAVDPNLYFFANHPRERVGTQEFEKFPYLLFPFFALGYFLIIEKSKQLLVTSFIIPVFFLSLIGHDSKIGPFLLFPFFAVASTVGLERLDKSAGKLSKIKKRTVCILFLSLYLLVFVQILIYASH